MNILKKIKPTKKEDREVKEIVSEFLLKLNRNLINAKAIVGGSFAKNTWLRSDHDIDIFVLFEKDYHISDMLEEALKKSFKKVVRIRGSRDYFQVKYKKYDFEIVPVFKIKNYKEAHNVTDVSPLHALWVKKHLTDKKADEVRLVKQFCKAQKVYGAETFIKGFSGYVLEILTVYYGSFENLLRNTVEWKQRERINVSKKRSWLRKSKLSSLNVIDPVQPNRNAAAALSYAKFMQFKEAARKYLENPSEEFFKIKKIKLSDIKKHEMVLVAEPLEGNRSVVGTKLMKAFEVIRSKFNREGFKISESGWTWNKKAYYWYDFEICELGKYKEHVGPPLSKKKHVRYFKLKHKGHRFVEKDKKIIVILPRKYTKAKDYLKEVLKDENIKRRVKSVKILKQ